MNTENEVEVIEEVVEPTDISEQLDADGNDTTDWKAQALANLELAKRNAGIAKRYKTKASKAVEKLVEPTSTPASSDLGEKAYLAVNDIRSADEVEFVQKMKKETGKDVESLLATTYFQTEFKNFKELKATAGAIPTGSKRSNNSSIDSVDYWVAKGELPPKEQVQLRRDVVNARLKKEQGQGVFYNS